MMIPREIAKALPRPPRRADSARGIPMIANARHAKGIENFLWISTHARRAFTGDSRRTLSAVASSSESDWARSDFS
jgi:hypothetical protein